MRKVRLLLVALRRPGWASECRLRKVRLLLAAMPDWPSAGRGRSRPIMGRLARDITMKMNDAYPSNYLKADVDVPEVGNLTMTIDRVEMVTFGQGKDAQEKPVVYFRETEKGLVLNKTNWRLIAQALGDDDTDTWEGKKIALYSADVQFGQDMMRGIRVSSRAPKIATRTVPKPEPITTSSTTDREDNDIPF